MPKENDFQGDETTKCKRLPSYCHRVLKMYSSPHQAVELFWLAAESS